MFYTIISILGWSVLIIVGTLGAIAILFGLFAVSDWLVLKSRPDNYWNDKPKLHRFLENICDLPIIFIWLILYIIWVVCYGCAAIVYIIFSGIAKLFRKITNK